MNESTLIALLLVIFAWSLLADRLASVNVSGPLAVATAGFVLGNASWGLVPVEVSSPTVHQLAEATLALLLFCDASSVSMAAARRDAGLTTRLLGIGLPLSIVAGTALAVLMWPALPLAFAGLIAASLAPTDAALSAAVINDERLPVRVRRVLNVESGLNDGIATPVVTFFVASAATVLGIAHTELAGAWGAVGELVIGVAVGGVGGFVGGIVLRVAEARRWTQEGSRRFATLALALAAYLVAAEVGGNPFVAAFVGGVAFGAGARRDAAESVELAELTGSLLSLVLWFVFGAGFVLPTVEHLDVRTVLYALASLTVLRMVPVALALASAGQDRRTVLFFGWFGPRGLASVVFALLAVEELGGTAPDVRLAVRVITLTIALSIVAHGMTARPLATRYIAGSTADDKGADQRADSEQPTEPD